MPAQRSPRHSTQPSTRTLRPIYYCLLDKYNFQESDHGKPWYQQSLPHAVLENAKALIYWNVPFILEKPPENGANKPDVIVHGKETNIWTLFEGTVCQVDKIAERSKEKQTKYIQSKKVQAYIKSILFSTFLEDTMNK